jgi:hypothetical protein
MRFQLKEAKRGKINATYHVVDEDQTICGSINVKLEEAGDLLRHWVGAGPSNTQPIANLPPHQSPVSALAKAFLKGRTKFSPQQVLRGCNA